MFHLLTKLLKLLPINFMLTTLQTLKHRLL